MMLDRPGRTDVVRGVLEKELVSRKFDLGEPGMVGQPRGSRRKAGKGERQRYSRGGHGR